MNDRRYNASMRRPFVAGTRSSRADSQDRSRFQPQLGRPGRGERQARHARRHPEAEPRRRGVQGQGGLREPCARRNRGSCSLAQRSRPAAAGRRRVDRHAGAHDPGRDHAVRREGDPRGHHRVRGLSWQRRAGPCARGRAETPGATTRRAFPRPEQPGAAAHRFGAQCRLRSRSCREPGDWRWCRSPVRSARR